MIRRPRAILAGITLLISAALLFVRLGHYALWDDEANTALIGEGVWATGDTTAVVGRNIVAYRGGADLENLRTRFIPPLQFYLAAPFTGPNAPSSFIARLPFTVFSLGTIALLLRWVARESNDQLLFAIFCIATLLNVEFFLYSRQCRYYAVSMFLSLAVCYLYRFWDSRALTRTLFALCAILLLASHYLYFAALVGCLSVDYLIWGRKQRWLTGRDWLAILLPVLIVGGTIFSIWNPLGKHVSLQQQPEPFWKRFVLFWWSVRDLNANQFYSAALVVAAIPIWLLWRELQFIPRALLALGLYTLMIAMASPQAVSTTSVADVRYVIPVIPLGMAIGAVVVWKLSFRRSWIAVPLAMLAFGTDVLNGGKYLSPPPMVPPPLTAFRSPPWLFVRELMDPPSDPYTVTSQWINSHVQENESIWVLPDFMNYPLMYHAPKAVYAWQLQYPPAPQFAQMPEIHFAGRVAPDYIIAFGPVVFELLKGFRPPPGIAYDQADVLDVFFKDLYRPELFWRKFQSVPPDKERGTAVYIFKKRLLSAATAPSNPAAPKAPPAPRPQSEPNSSFHL